MTAGARSTGGRWLALIAAAALLVIGLDFAMDLRAPPRGPPAAMAVAGLPESYDQELAQIGQVVAAARDNAAAHPDEWIRQEVLGRALMSRARLTGSYDDYAAAQAAIDRGFALAPSGAGPHLAQALLDFKMHRLARTERMLGALDRYAIPPASGELAEMDAMRGDIAFYRGDYAGARALYAKADALTPGITSLRRAVYAARTGNLHESEQYFDAAIAGEKLPRRLTLATYALQRGAFELEAGEWDKALAHFREADRIFPGYWLIEEHIAEVTALKGDPERAERMYRAIVERTGHPEFMDALADLAAQRGDEATALAWRKRAGAVWQRRLKQFPEASYGHAIDHCISGGDWSCALRLAERNHQARPHGEAKVLLAKALLRNNRKEEARAMIESVLASPWRTAATHAVAADIYAAFGETDRAEAQRKAALVLNPHALDGGAISLTSPSAT